MRIISCLKRFALAPSVDRELFLKAAVLLLLMRGALRVISFQTLWRCLEKAGLVRVSFTPRPSSVVPDQVSRALKRAACYLPGATCLVQALAATVMLSRYGHRASLCIGVAKAGGAFGAHAWVECEGPVVIGVKGQFTTLLILPGAVS